MKQKYRKGVGIFLINKRNQLWVGKRFDYKNEYWQMPQGGIDELESPEKAMKRELMEETGLPVIVTDDPLTCVVRGSGLSLEMLDNAGIFTTD